MNTVFFVCESSFDQIKAKNYCRLLEESYEVSSRVIVL